MSILHSNQTNCHQFLLVGNGPYLNRGCEAIVRGTMVILRHQFGENFRVTLASYGSSELIARQAEQETDPLIRHVALPSPIYPRLMPYDLRWWRMMLLRGYSRLARLAGKSNQYYVPDGVTQDLSILDEASATACLALQVGGDNYSLDYGVPIRFFLLDEYLWSHRIPVVLWGASVGPFEKSPFFAPKAFEHLRKIQLILLREEASREYLRSHEVLNVERMSDPAFMMDPVEPDRQKLGGSLPKQPLGVNLSPLMARYVTDGDRQRWISMCTAIVEQICRSTDHPVMLIPHVTMPGNNDHIFLQEVASCAAPDLRSRIVCLGDNLSAAETKWVIARCVAFVGARTHATIAAMSSGVPTLSLAYSMKARGLNQEVFGTQDYCINPRDISPIMVTDRLQMICERGDAIRQHLNKSLASIREMALSGGKHLAILLNASHDSASIGPIL